MTLSGSEMYVKIKLGGLQINNASLYGQVPISRFTDIFGPATRTEKLQVNGRSVALYDELGIYSVEDASEDRIVYVAFVFEVSKVRFRPLVPFSGILSINGKTIRKGMTIGDAPVVGEVGFVKGIGATWKAVHDHAYVEMNFGKVARSSVKRIISVTHSFLKD